MKNNIYLIFAFLLALLSVQTTFAENDVKHQKLSTFFQTTQSGDVDSIYQMLTDPLKSRMESLLKKNKSYRNLLRKKYLHASFVINQVTDSSDSTKIANVTVFYQDGSKSNHTFIMKEVSPQNWKISDEIFQ